MARAEERIRQYLYAGESVREAFDVGPSRVVMTSHRVFTSRPDETGIEQADLPNVSGVERVVQGSTSKLMSGIWFVVAGVTLIVIGIITSISDLFTAPGFDTSTASRFGSDSLVEIIEAVLWIVENLGVLVATVGVLTLGVGGLFVAYYWFRVREPSLVIRLAGDQPDIHLPLSEVPIDDERRLEEALDPAHTAPAGGDTGYTGPTAPPSDTTGGGRDTFSADGPGQGTVVDPEHGDQDTGGDAVFDVGEGGSSGADDDPFDWVDSPDADEDDGLSDGSSP